VQSFTNFTTFLAPPSRDTSHEHLSSGQHHFEEIGCAGCHTQREFRTPQHPANGVPGHFSFQPYSDFLVHDMGSLGDQIGNAGDSVAVTRRMRTAPLWGIRFRTLLLHDGRAMDIPSAILAHDGQGATARNKFQALSSHDKHELVEFVASL